MENQKETPSSEELTDQKNISKEITETESQIEEKISEKTEELLEEIKEEGKQPADVVAEEAPETPTEEVEEVVAEEAPETPTEEVVEDVAEVAPETATEEVEEVVAEEAPETPTEEVEEVVAEEAPETPTEEVAEVVAEEAPETPTEEIAEVVAEEAQETPTEEVAEVVAEEAQETPTEEVAEVVAEEAPETPTEEVAEVVAEEAQETPAEEVEEVVAEEAPETPAEKVEEVVAEEASETPAEEGGELVIDPLPDPVAVDYAQLELSALLSLFETTSINGDLNKERSNLENMKHLLNVKFGDDRKERFKAHAATGKSAEEFDYETAELKTFKESIARIGKRRSEIRKQREEKRESAVKKRAIILDTMKELVDSENILDHSKKFRDLQGEWRSISNVPSDDMKTAWDRFHIYSDKFYNALKINRQLREMDFQRNMKSKISICEQAEELLLMDKLNEQVKALHALHSRWKEIGPVPNEKREELWERFKLSSEKIHERRRAFYEEQEGNREENLTAKTKFCEDAEKLLDESPQKHGEWQKLTEKFLALQEQWRKVGPVPREVSEDIWQRFKGACDIFFTRKSEFYKVYRESQQQNMHLKMDLIGQAEAMAESTNWKKTSTDLINLQKEWKKIGPVPRKHSDKLWAKFRGACDTFFNSKKEHFAGMDDRYEDNLKEKLELIDKIEGFNLSQDQEENMGALKTFQSNWMKIGYVPMAEKDQVFEKYRNAINKIFDALQLSKDERSEMKFQNKVDQLRKEGGGNDALRRERNTLNTQINKLQSEISLLENNIEFFSNSSNSQELRREVEQKISKAEKQIDRLKGKIRMIAD